MTKSASDVLRGVQEPTLIHRPSDVRSNVAAEEALELADKAGMTLDDAQRGMLTMALGEQADGKWSAFEVCDVQPRQNGKGDTIQARELAGLFVFGERLIIHTAHEFPTANEAFLRMAALIQSSPDLEAQVQRIRYANGEQGVELKSGARLKYRARTGGAGRGFANASLVVYDEAYALQSEHVAASLPTLSTSENPQVWFASSAGLGHSSQLWSLRRRALEGGAGRLAYSEFTAEDVSLDDAGRLVSHPIDVHDRRLWAVANPALGRRISEAYIESELAAMGDEKFARERLGVWDPLLGEEHLEAKLPARAWEATVIESHDVPVMMPGAVTLAFDVSIDGEWSSVVVGGGDIRSPYVELVEHRKGTGWLPSMLVQLARQWEPLAIGCNNAGPAGAQVGAVLTALREAELDPELLTPMGAAEFKRACGGFFADVVEGRLTRPNGQKPLDAAGADAGERTLGDAWAWDVRQATVPICPLVAATVARALLPTERPVEEEPQPTFAY